MSELHEIPLEQLRPALAQAKKGVLVELVLNCGVDLRGRLPKEIADWPKLESSIDDEED